MRALAIALIVSARRRGRKECAVPCRAAPHRPRSRTRMCTPAQNPLCARAHERTQSIRMFSGYKT